MRTNADITIYNKYYVGRDEAFQRIQLKGVYWEDRRAVNQLASGGNIAADKVLVMIPFIGHDGYLDPVEWLALEDKSENWTLNSNDIIVRGLVEDEIEPGFTPSDLERKYQNVLRITSVDSFNAGSPRMQHWEVGAK
jgi:hypothetical protein